MGTSRRSDLETCEKNSGVLDRRKRARCIVSVTINLSPCMMFRHWKSNTGQHIGAFLRRVAQLQDQQTDLHQQATAAATANSEKKGLFLLRMP